MNQALYREPKPYRIVAKIKNNRLWTAIQEMFPGANQRHAAEKLGVGESLLGCYLNMTIFPYKYHQRYWSKSSRRIAGQLGHPVDYLFDPTLYGRKPLPQVELEIDPRDLPALNLIALPPAPDEVLDHALLRAKIQEVLLNFTERERTVLSDRFGLNGEVRSLEEIACDQNVTRERIRQIENKALRKLQHPTWNRGLREHY